MVADVSAVPKIYDNKISETQSGSQFGDMDTANEPGQRKNDELSRCEHTTQFSVLHFISLIKANKQQPKVLNTLVVVFG